MNEEKIEESSTNMMDGPEVCSCLLDNLGQMECIIRDYAEQKQYSTPGTLKQPGKAKPQTGNPVSPGPVNFVDKEGRIKKDPKTDYLPLITRSNTRRIPLEDVNYLKLESGHITIYLSCGESVQMIGDFNKVYPFMNRDFQHVMKTGIVNMANISCMQNSTIYFFGGQRYLIGEVNFHKMRHAYNRYLERGMV